MPSAKALYSHTNHYLTPGNPIKASTHSCSTTRQKRLQQLLAELKEQTPVSMKAILSNIEEPYPVLRPYSFNELIGDAGTLATLIMNMNQLTLHVRQGFDSETPFIEYKFN